MSSWPVTDAYARVVSSRSSATARVVVVGEIAIRRLFLPTSAIAITIINPAPLTTAIDRIGDELAFVRHFFFTRKMGFRMFLIDFVIATVAA